MWNIRRLRGLMGTTGLVVWTGMGAPLRAQTSELAIGVGGLLFPESQFDATPYVDGTYSLVVDGRYGLEATVGGTPLATEGIVEDPAANPREVGAVHFLLYYVNALFRFPRSPRFVPFTTLGVGGITTFAEAGFSRTQLAVTFGVGYRLQLHRQWALRLDLRDFVSSIRIGFFDPLTGRTLLSPSGARHSLQLKAGLSVAL